MCVFNVCETSALRNSTTKKNALKEEILADSQISNLNWINTEVNLIPQKLSKLLRFSYQVIAFLDFSQTLLKIFRF